jgi:hypothetical protein
MKCPTCGNEVTQGEVFCGQCGTPSMAVPPGYHGMNTPSPRSGLLSTGAYAANTAFVPPPNTYQPGTFTPTQAQSPHVPSGALTPPNSAPLAPANPYQQTGFYHDATEAMSPVQHPHSGLLPGYSPQPARGQFSPQAAPVTHPFQTGNYAGPMPTQHPFSTGQSYHNGLPSQFPSPPPKQGNQIILIVCVVLVVVLLGVVSITTVALLNRPDTNKTAAPPTVVPTIAPTIAPTVAPTPTPMPTATPVPTAAPDAGFAWCGTNCNQYGFTTEFPVAWPGTPATNSQGVQFTNPAMPNVYASFKTPGATGDTPANVLMNDVQSTFGSQPGYAAPTPPPAANATIGGAPWYAIATNYNDNQNQPIHVEVYATVYQGKAYIIELQAPAENGQFDSVKQQFFVNMLVKFQFLPTAQ